MRGAQTGHPSGCDQPQVVTAPGHRRGVHCELTQNRGYFVGGAGRSQPKAAIGEVLLTGTTGLKPSFRAFLGWCGKAMKKQRTRTIWVTYHSKGKAGEYLFLSIVQTHQK